MPVTVFVDLQPLPVILGLYGAGPALQPLVQRPDRDTISQLRLEGLHQLDGNLVQSYGWVLEALAHLSQVRRHVVQVSGVGMEGLRGIVEIGFGFRIA